MKNLIRKILKIDNSKNPETKSGNVKDTTNAVFEKYKKSFKDLARYDREGEARTN